MSLLLVIFCFQEELNFLMPQMSIRGENEREIPLEFRWGVSDFQFLCRESVHPSDLPVICE